MLLLEDRTETNWEYKQHFFSARVVDKWNYKTVSAPSMNVLKSNLITIGHHITVGVYMLV